MIRLTVTWYLILCFLLNAAALAFLAVDIVSRYPHNHVGINPWHMALISLATLGAIVAPWLMNSKWKFAVCGSWIAFACTLIALDLFSVMLEHGEWCHRGMPEWGTPIWKTRLFEEPSAS